MAALLENRVVVIIGGAGRIGRAFSAAVVANGGVAIVADVDVAAAESVAAAVSPAAVGRAEAAHVDLGDPSTVRALIADLAERHGRIDAGVCSIYPKSPNYGRKFDAVAHEDFSEHLRLHVGAYFVVAQEFGAHFVRQGGGHIVNVASIYGVIPPRFEIYEGTEMTVPIEYAAAKAAILQMTAYLAKHYKRKNIRVNAITPGGILDGQPAPFLQRYNAECLGKGMLDAGDIAGTLVFLLSDLSAHINGQNLVVDDGFTL